MTARRGVPRGVRAGLPEQLHDPQRGVPMRAAVRRGTHGGAPHLRRARPRTTPRRTHGSRDRSAPDSFRGPRIRTPRASDIAPPDPKSERNPPRSLPPPHAPSAFATDQRALNGDVLLPQRPGLTRAQAPGRRRYLLALCCYKLRRLPEAAALCAPTRSHPRSPSDRNPSAQPRTRRSIASRGAAGLPSSGSCARRRAGGARRRCRASPTAALALDPFLWCAHEALCASARARRRGTR